MKSVCVCVGGSGGPDGTDGLATTQSQGLGRMREAGEGVNGKRKAVGTGVWTEPSEGPWFAEGQATAERSPCASPGGHTHLACPS